MTSETAQSTSSIKAHVGIEVTSLNSDSILMSNRSAAFYDTEIQQICARWVLGGQTHTAVARMILAG